MSTLQKNCKKMALEKLAHFNPIQFSIMIEAIDESNCQNQYSPEIFHVNLMEKWKNNLMDVFGIL
jgi:hypothetical protein